LNKYSGKGVVLLPAYNEASAIENLVDNFARVITHDNLLLTLVLIDDGSFDETRLLFEERCKSLAINHLVLPHSQNLGLSEAMRTGFNFFINSKPIFDFAIVMDSDNTHLPSQIPEMIKCWESGAKVVIASRFMEKSAISGLSFSRTFLSYLGNYYLRFFSNSRVVKDYTCGFRLYDFRSVSFLRDSTNGSFFESRGFDCMPEIMLRLVNFFQDDIYSIPLQLRYDNKSSPSKMKVFDNTLKVLKLPFRVFSITEIVTRKLQK
jgi:dolichol-phosphate mannosyltransferase